MQIPESETTPTDIPKGWRVSRIVFECGDYEATIVKPVGSPLFGNARVEDFVVARGATYLEAANNAVEKINAKI